MSLSSEFRIPNSEFEASTYRVERFGPWTAERIRVGFALAEFVPPADRAELIERTFGAEQAAAEATGRLLFNGKLARMASCTGDGGRLEVRLQPTEFKAFLSTNLLHADQFGPTERADAIGVSTMIRSLDERLIFGRRSGQVMANRGVLHAIGGVVDWIRPPPSGQADGRWLFDELLKELNEEVGILPEDVRGTTALVLARDKRFWQPELLCLTQVDAVAEVLIDRWRASGDREHDDLWPMPDTLEAAVAALRPAAGRAPFSPLATAAILAHVSIAFGQDALGPLLTAD